MSAIVDKIDSGCRQLGLQLSGIQQEKLEAFIGLLVKWNNTYNLTAIREPEEMVVYHLLDSIVLWDCFTDSQQSIIDVGSGAGIPGIPLSIILPDKKFTLLDSNGKKTRFITQAKLELGLENCSVVKQRAEQFPTTSSFDVVLSRAFSSLKGFVQTTGHLLGPQGFFYAMKGKIPLAEIEELPAGVYLEGIEPLQVPYLSEQRHLVVLRKTT